MDGPLFQEAVRLFNAGAFFECHEVLEDLWHPLPPGNEKRFLQGVLQVAVGLHHLKNKNRVGARNLLAAGLEKLRTVQQEIAFEPPIDLIPLVQSAQDLLDSLHKEQPGPAQERSPVVLSVSKKPPRP